MEQHAYAVRKIGSRRYRPQPQQEDIWDLHWPEVTALQREERIEAHDWHTVTWLRLDPESHYWDPGLFRAWKLAPEGSFEYLNDLLSAVQKSRSILDLRENWDGEGSPGYTEDTWRRATDLLVSGVRHMWEQYSELVPVPRILPGPDGSIDIHWEVGHRHLLLNIPAGADDRAAYYGQHRADPSKNIKGSFDPSQIELPMFFWVRSEG